jgi:hypothetical protein
MPVVPCREAIVRSPEFLIERLAPLTIRQAVGAAPDRPVRLMSSLTQPPGASRVKTMGRVAPPSFNVPEICPPSALNAPVNVAGVIGDVSVKVPSSCTIATGVAGEPPTVQVPVAVRSA